MGPDTKRFPKKRLPEQPGDVPVSCADIAKAGRMLGYHPATSIEEGIEKFIEWFQIHRVASQARE